jgi:hypothetical protein
MDSGALDRQGRMAINGDTRQPRVLILGAGFGGLSADMGCLLNIAGKLKRKGSRVEARHVAEVLAGMAQDAAIGEGQ